MIHLENCFIQDFMCVQFNNWEILATLIFYIFFSSSESRVHKLYILVFVLKVAERGKKFLQWNLDNVMVYGLLHLCS